jgi:predicted flap endonuclease-1-like 5' DNA nuclease
MSKLTTLPYAAVGVAAKTVRTVNTRFGDFISQSADEGRRAVSRIPGSTRLLGATNASSRPVTDIIGVNARTATKLNSAGVNTVADMWAHGGDRSGRATLSGRTGIDADQLSIWARHADLMRVKAIGPRYAALLDVAGVTSLKQLRRRNAEALHDLLESTNRTAKVVETLPGIDEISEWIERASLIAG